MGDAVVEGRPRRGFLAHLSGLLFSPREEFQDILVRPGFWLPLVGIVLLAVLVGAVWLRKADLRAVAEAQFEMGPMAKWIPEEQRPIAIQRQVRVMPYTYWLNPIIGGAFVVFGLGALYLLIFRFMLGGQMTFRQSTSVVAWSFLTVALVTAPLSLLTMALKGDWNVADPSLALQGSLSVALDKATTSKALYSLAERFDIFSFWRIGLLAVGFSVADRRSFGSALAGVLGTWGLFVVLAVALSALFG